MNEFKKKMAVSVPEHLLGPLTNGTTSLLDNPSIPSFGGNGLLVNLVAEKVSEFSDITADSVPAMRDELAKCVTECMKIESDNRNALEKLCVDIVKENLDIPDDMVKFNAELTETIDTSGQRLLPETEDDYSYENLDDMDRMDAEIAKRRLLDALAMGAAVTMSSDIDGYIREVFAVNPDLPKLYKRIVEINNALLYVDQSVTDDAGHSDGGTVTVRLTGSDKEVVVESKGMVFPMLLSETFKGVFEIATSHGLPNESRRAKHIIDHADFLSADLWDMRLGTLLWKRITDMLPDKNMNPVYILMTLSEIGTDEFHHSMKEIFAGTRRGKEILDGVCEDIADGLDRDEFEEYMSNMSDTYRMDDSEDIELYGDDDGLILN